MPAAVPSAAHLADCLTALRTAAPLVHNVTNYVAMDLSANVLLALGASPAMVHAPEEAAEFAALSAAVAINIGTLSPAWVDGMVAAAGAAAAKGTPWVLDPVGAGATMFRNRTVDRLLALKPTVIRANASEILAVAVRAGGGKGVDSVNTPEEARDAAMDLARRTGAVVVVSGAVDLVTDGTRGLRLDGGSPIMTKVTAVGCALSATTAAFCAVTKDPLAAAAAAAAVFDVAGASAAAGTPGPGTFRTAFLDALHALTPDALRAGTRIVEAW